MKSKKEQRVKSALKQTRRSVQRGPVGSSEVLRKREAHATRTRINQMLATITNPTEKEARDSRRAALNLIEDAVRAREQVEKLNLSLRHSEERLRMALSTGRFGYWQIDLPDMTLTCSAECKAIFGRAPDDIFTHDWMMESIHPDDRKRVEDVVSLAIKTVSSYEADYRIIWPDKTLHWIDARGRVLAGPTGEAGTVIGMTLDITERKEAEERLANGLADTVRLQDISTQLIREYDADLLYQKIVDGAMAIMRSQYAAMQMFNPAQNGELHLLSARVRSNTKKFTELIHSASEAISRQILRTGKRFIASNLERNGFMLGLRELEAYLEIGISAAQATPLFSRDGRMVGMITNYWSRPHEPSDRDLRLLDILARQAADLIERKQAEQALLESEQRFRSLVSVITDVVWTTDPSGAFSQLQPAWEAYTGQSYQEYRGFGWVNALHPDDQERVRSLWVNSEEKRSLFESDGRLWHAPSRQYRYFVARATPLLDSEGAVREWIGACTDVEQQRRAEEAVRSSEERFRVMADNISQLAWTCEQLGSVTWYNQRWLDYTGFSFDEMHDWGWTKVQHPDHVDRVVAGMMLARKSGEVWEDTFPLRGRAGNYRWFLSRAVPIKDDEGKVVRWFGTNTDVTEQMEVEHALRQSDTRFRQLADAMPQIVWAAQPDGYIDYYNERWYEYTGLTDCDGKESWKPILHPDDADHCVEKFFSCIRTEQPFELEYRFKDSSGGGYRWFLERGVPIRDEKGTVVHWYGTCTDINDIKRTEQELSDFIKLEQAARTEAEVANRSKDDFLAVLSHELRTPLNVIAGWTRLLVSGRLDQETTKRAIETIDRNVGAQSKIIDELLYTARIASGKVHLDREPVDLVSVVEAAMEVMYPAFKAKGIEATSDFDLTVGPLIGDSVRLQQVIWNLLSNAVKFTPEGGHINVKIERSGDSAVVIVSDTGQGIDEDFLPYMFDRFQQADRGEKRKHGGLGLGLSIARHLVERHGGEIRGESEGKDKGATFTITLPIMQSQDLAAVATTRDESAVATDSKPARVSDVPADVLRGLRIVVVDDQPDTLELLTYALIRYGAEIKVCQSAAEAIEAVPDWKPDVIVSDIGMPGEDGYEMMMKIRALEQGEGRQTPALALTGYVSREDEMKAAAAGFESHLPKPVKLDRLAITIANLARRSSRDASGNH